MREPIFYLASCCCSSMFVKDYEIDEEIDLYQRCLDEDDKNWTLKEEENCRAYGISTMLPSTMESIETAEYNAKYHLEGIHTYDILRNPIYTQQF